MFDCVLMHFAIKAACQLWLACFCLSLCLWWISFKPAQRVAGCIGAAVRFAEKTKNSCVTSAPGSLNCFNHAGLRLSSVGIWRRCCSFTPSIANAGWPLPLRAWLRVAHAWLFWGSNGYIGVEHCCVAASGCLLQSCVLLAKCMGVMKHAACRRVSYAWWRACVQMFIRQ